MEMNLEFYKTILDNYSRFKLKHISGRYLSETDLLNTFKKFSHHIEIRNEGNSVEQRIISSFRIGRGAIKILMWSQMHGNETTTTKAIFDFMQFCIHKTYPAVVKQILERFTFIIIPVLNPDAAVRYTRHNAHHVDLNRDASALEEPESRVLRQVFDSFQPDYCFNMHDQRSIFSAGDHAKPASVSFLSPAYNEACDLNPTRERAMALIESANSVLQQFIPGQIGRYDDQFNINCVGDFFQSRGVPTVLFEAGHIADDYDREQTRTYIFIAILEMLRSIDTPKIGSHQAYFDIPENKK